MSTATVKQAEQSVQLSQTFQFPVAQVYQAWIQPDAVNQWLGGGCKGASNTRKIEMDVRSGGEWKIQTNPEYGHSFDIYGTYQEVVPNRKLVFTWNADQCSYGPGAKDSLVTVVFRDLGQATEVTLMHERFANTTETEAHTYGWTISFEALVSHLQQAA